MVNPREASNTPNYKAILEQETKKTDAVLTDIAKNHTWNINLYQEIYSLMREHCTFTLDRVPQNTQSQFAQSQHNPEQQDARMHRLGFEIHRKELTDHEFSSLHNMCEKIVNTIEDVKIKYPIESGEDLEAEILNVTNRLLSPSPEGDQAITLAPANSDQAIIADCIIRQAIMTGNANKASLNKADKEFISVLEGVHARLGKIRTQQNGKLLNFDFLEMVMDRLSDDANINVEYRPYTDDFKLHHKSYQSPLQSVEANEEILRSGIGKLTDGSIRKTDKMLRDPEWQENILHVDMLIAKQIEGFITAENSREDTVKSMTFRYAIKKINREWERHPNNTHDEDPADRNFALLDSIINVMPLNSRDSQKNDVERDKGSLSHIYRSSNEANIRAHCMLICNHCKFSVEGSGMSPNVSIKQSDNTGVALTAEEARILRDNLPKAMGKLAQIRTPATKDEWTQQLVQSIKDEQDPEAREFQEALLACIVQTANSSTKGKHMTYNNFSIYSDKKINFPNSFDAMSKALDILHNERKEMAKKMRPAPSAESLKWSANRDRLSLLASQGKWNSDEYKRLTAEQDKIRRQHDRNQERKEKGISDEEWARTLEKEAQQEKLDAALEASHNARLARLTAEDEAAGRKPFLAEWEEQRKRREELKKAQEHEEMMKYIVAKSKLGLRCADMPSPSQVTSSTENPFTNTHTMPSSSVASADWEKASEIDISAKNSVASKASDTAEREQDRESERSLSTLKLRLDSISGYRNSSDGKSGGGRGGF